MDSILCENDLDGLILRCLIHNPQYTNLEVKSWMDIDATCNDFSYCGDNFDLRVESVRAEMESWDE